MRTLKLAWILGLVAGMTGIIESAHALTQRGVGTVMAVRGEASVSHLPEVAAGAGRPARESLKFQDDVFFRDVIDTQRHGGAKLLLKGRAVFTVRELTRVELVEGVVPADSGRTRSIVHVLAGAVRALVQRDVLPHNELEIHTPNATSAIRGTELIAEVFHPGTPVPPLPFAGSRQPGGPGTPAADVVSRFYVRKGLIEVEGLFAAAGQGIEKVGNQPPRLFQFAATYFEDMVITFAVPQNPPHLGGNILSRSPVVPNGQAAPSVQPMVQPEVGNGVPSDNVPPSKSSVGPSKPAPSAKMIPSDVFPSRFLAPDGRSLRFGIFK